MKRLIAILLLLTMALGLCACGTKNVPNRFWGTWQTADGTATLTLNEDGTATFVKTDGDNAGTYNFLWICESNNAITIKWDGEPIPATAEMLEALEDEAEATTPVTEETTPVEETTTEETTPVVEETTPVEETAPVADPVTGETTSATKRDDPSVVGFGGMTVEKGEMKLYLNEGTSTDILLFVYNGTNKKPLIKID